MLLTKDYYRVAFENRLRTNQLGDVDDYNLKLAKLKNNSYPLPYSFNGDYTEHLTHENLFRRFGTVIHTGIEEGNSRDYGNPTLHCGSYHRSLRVCDRILSSMYGFLFPVNLPELRRLKWLGCITVTVDILSPPLL